MVPWLDFQASGSKPIISRNTTIVQTSSLKEPDVPLRSVTEVANKLLPYKTFEKK